MASSIKGLSSYDKVTMPNAESYKFGILVSEYHDKICNTLLKGCVDTLREHGATDAHIDIIYVPGAFELIAGAHLAAEKGVYDAIITLGCVIKGDTKHDDYINHAVAQGLSDITIKTGIPVIFGLLTVNDEAQAIERSGGKHGNKGVECAAAAIKMAFLKQG